MNDPELTIGEWGNSYVTTSRIDTPSLDKAIMAIDAVESGKADIPIPEAIYLVRDALIEIREIISRVK